MKATIENLKANRKEIIATLIEKFTEDNLRSAMLILKDRVEDAEMFSPKDSLSYVLEQLIKDNPFHVSSRKVSKLATLIGKIEELKA